MGLFDKGRIEALRQDFDKRLQEVEMEKSKQILEVEQRMVEISEKRALEKANEIHSIWLEEFEKANGEKDKKKGEDLDAKSLFIDPYQMLESIGFRERPMMLGFDQLRLMSERNPIIAAVINTRVNQVASFSRTPRSDYDIGYKFYMRDIDEKPTKADERRMKEMTAFCDATGFPGKVEEEARDVFDSFLRKSSRDSLTYDQMCYEIVPSKKGTPGAFYAIDAATVRLATTPDYWRDRRKVGGYYERNKDDSRQDEERMKMLANWTNAVDKDTDPMDLRYVQILMGKVINTYTEKEMCFGIRNPRTSVRLNGYGTSELEILVNTVVAHMWTEEHNRRFFSQGSAPKGIIHFEGANINQEHLQAFRRQWHSQIAGVYNAWRTPIIASPSKLNYTSLHTNNRQMEFSNWLDYLVKVICFPPDMRIAMSDGSMRNINEVEPGESIFTHSGKVSLIRNIQVKHHKGKLINLRAGGKVIRSTENHPFYVCSSYVGSYMQREFDDPEWVRADEIVEGEDYLMLPKPRIDESTLTSSRIDLSKYVDVDIDGDLIKLKANSSRKVPRYIELTEENAFVLGLYVAEGYATDYNFRFCLNSKETEYGDAIKAFAVRMSLSEPYDASQKESSLVLCLYSGVFSRAFKNLFGALSLQKKIPQEILTAPLSVQKAFLSGIIAGDGSVWKAKRSISLGITTYSKTLSDQLQYMFLLQNIYATVYDTIRTNDERHGGFKNGESISFNIRISGKQLQDISTWLIGPKANYLRELESDPRQQKQKFYETPSYFLIPVVETWEENYDGEVYNMEVEDEHTYTVERFGVHNCAVYLIDPSEINFELRGAGHQQAPMFESNNEAKQKLSRDRGLKPLLKFLESEFNKNVIYQIDPRFEFQFVGLDAKTEEQRQKLRTERLQYYVTIDETRIEDDLKPLGEEKGGDLIMNTVYTQYMLQLKMQQQQEQMGGMGGGGGEGQDFGEEGEESKYDFGAEGEEGEAGEEKGATPGREAGGGAKPETAPGREFGGGGAPKGEKL